MAQWTDIPFDERVFQNVAETVLTKNTAALENAFLNEADGQTRFPGTREFATLSGTKTYLSTHRGNLLAVTDEGKIYLIDKSGNATDVTGVPVSGGRRAVFSETQDEKLIAAGGPIIRLASGQSEVLSEDAPLSTHAVFISGYVVAIEINSGRFYHSEAGLYRQWDPLDVFSAEGKPDDINAAVVTPFDELLLTGPDSIEQYESAVGTVPFVRRWSNGEGIIAPYTVVAEDNGTWGVNRDREIVRFAGQAIREESDAVNLVLESIPSEDWEDAWAAVIKIKGQTFYTLQIPNATNPYGTRGVTLAYRQGPGRVGAFCSLYNWDDDISVPARWRPWSYQEIWGRHFVGVEGGVEELAVDAYCHCGGVQRVLSRTAHIHDWGPSRIDDFWVRVKRGQRGTNGEPGRIGVRVNRDNLGFGPWIYRDLGIEGDRHMTLHFDAFGEADTWQFEYAVTDPVDVEFVAAKAYVERLRR